MPLVLDGTNGVSGVDGTASNPAIEGTDSNTGIFYPAADTVAIGTGGTERLRVDSAGNAGLGVTPSAWTNARTALQIGGTTVAGLGFAGAISETYTNAYVNSGVYKYFTTGSAGIFDFNNAASGGFSWRIAGSGTAGNTITWNQAMTLDASGRLGIGATSTPASYQNILGYFQNGRSGWAYVVDDSANTHIVHNIIFNGTNNTYAGNGYASRMSIIDADGSFRWYQAASGSSGGVATLNERARITSGGAFYVGTTTANFSGKFEVVDSGATAVGFTNTSGTATNQVLGLWQQAGSGNNLWVQFYSDAGGTSRGSIDYNRGSALTRYNTTSDATLKNIIGDSDGQKSVEILNSTRIREYAWKDDEQQKPQIGVIAQELYETYKGAVSVGGDIEKTDEEGNVTTEYRPWGVDKTAFTFHLIAGWQAHEKMIQELKAEIALLKGAA